MYHRGLLLNPGEDNHEDRWLPSISMWLVSLISYIDRNTLAILAPVILRETHLNAEQYGFIISCFSVAYMIANPVWGLILDRWGVRRGMTTAVGIWALASAAHALATGKAVMSPQHAAGPANRRRPAGLHRRAGSKGRLCSPHAAARG